MRITGAHRYHGTDVHKDCSSTLHRETNRTASRILVETWGGPNSRGSLFEHTEVGSAKVHGKIREGHIKDEAANPNPGDSLSGRFGRCHSET